MRRRLFLASAASALAGCGPIGSALNNNDNVRRILASAEGLNHFLIGTRGLAREYRDNDVDRHFRVNGFDHIRNGERPCFFGKDRVESDLQQQIA